MNSRIAVSSVILAFILAGVAASAQEESPSDRAPVTREDRAAAREAMRERFADMPEEERAAARERMCANREAMREALRERREAGEFGRPRRRPGGPGRPRGPGAPSGDSEPDA